MIIPVRCFTCGRVVADKYQLYTDLIQDYNEDEALDTLGFNRYCCRRMFLTHVDFSDQLLKFNPADNAAGIATLGLAQGDAVENGGAARF